MPLQILIIGMAGHAMTGRLAAELAARGHAAGVVHPDRLVAEVTAAGVRVGHVTDTPPDVVFSTVSSDHVPAAIAVDLLQAAGARVVNPASATLLAADKFRSAITMNRAGVAVPHALCASTPETAAAAADALGYPVVLKASDGAEGAQVRRVSGPDQLADAFVEVRRASDQSAQARTPVIVQQVIGDRPGRDRRIFVCGGVAQAAMDRVARPGEWRSNLSLGARPVAAEATAEQAELAVRAAAALGLDFGCVDLIGEGGDAQVIEVNPYGDMLDVAMVSGLDLIGALADLVEQRGGLREPGPVRARRLSTVAHDAITAFCCDRLRRKAVELGLPER